MSYSPHAREKGQGSESYNPRLDLVLFVNGIPTATLELKSQFKQTVENAKRQYRHDRPVKDPVTRKPEPLLTFKRGALVHFAVSQAQMAMTTRLAGNAAQYGQRALWSPAERSCATALQGGISRRLHTPTCATLILVALALLSGICLPP